MPPYQYKTATEFTDYRNKLIERLQSRRRSYLLLSDHRTYKKYNNPLLSPLPPGYTDQIQRLI